MHWNNLVTLWKYLDARALPQLSESASGGFFRAAMAENFALDDDASLSSE